MCAFIGSNLLTPRVTRPPCPDMIQALKKAWTWWLARLRSSDLPDTYATVARRRSVVAADGGVFDPKSENGSSASPLASAPGDVGFISRHALASDVTCPVCSGFASEANPWRRVVLSDKYGEGIGCDSCSAMLFACPDDAIDPVKPGQMYDESIYHRFARPDGWKPQRQRTTSDAPKVGDWVVIEKYTGPVDVNGVMQDMPLDGSEGIAVVERPDSYKVALGGNEGVGGSGSKGSGTLGGVYADIPRANVFVMILPILRVGDRVRIVRGKLRKMTAKVLDMRGGSIEVAIYEGENKQNAARVTLPIEYLEKIHESERFVTN